MNRIFDFSQACPQTLTFLRGEHGSPWDGYARIFLALALLGITVSPAGAAQFRGLEEDQDYALSLVVSVESSGDQIVGVLTPTDSSGPISTAAVWDEETHDFAFVGPTPAAARRSKAVSQVTAQDGSIRLTFGSIEPADPSRDQRVWIQTEDLELNTVTSAIISPHPSAAVANEAVAISRHGHRLINYGPTGAQVASFYDPASGNYADLDDIVARGMDAEGTRVVGFGRDGAVRNARQAILWSTQTRTILELGPLSGGTGAAALGISHSGRIVVGESESAAVGGSLREAFRWHPDIGIQSLEPIHDGASRESAALATSDGNVVVGRYRDAASQTSRAFLWTPSGGRVDLQNLLAGDLGLSSEVAGWSLTEAVAISADGQVIAGNGVNPEGDPQGWVVDLTDENRAEVLVRESGLSDEWEIFLECGDAPISELNFGLIAPETFAFDDSFNFADCQASIDVPVGVGGPFPLVLDALECSNTDAAARIAPSVSPLSYVIKPQQFDGSGVETARANTFYFSFFGDGGPEGDTLCEPGDSEFLLGVFELAANGGTVEPTPSPYAATIGSDTRGDLVPDSQFVLRREFPGPSPSIFVEREIRDTQGARWLVSLDSPEAFSKFSFGIIVPPTGDPVSFGDCNVDLEGAPRTEQDRRGCIDGSALGPWVDFSSVRTVGPSSDLQQYGMRPDTLYVYMEGAFSGPGVLEQLNAANGNMKLGEFSFDGQISSFPGYAPTLTFEGVENFDQAWGEVEDWADLDGNPARFSANKMAASKSRSASKTGGAQGGSTGGRGGAASESGDSDGIADNMDNCPYADNADQADNGTLQVMDGITELVGPTATDTIGDVCQCGEAEDNASVIMDDVYDLRSALASVTEAATISSESKDRCNTVGVESTAIDSVTGLAEDCDINDVFVILKGREGEAPLYVSPLDPPACPSS